MQRVNQTRAEAPITRKKVVSMGSGAVYSAIITQARIPLNQYSDALINCTLGNVPSGTTAETKITFVNTQMTEDEKKAFLKSNEFQQIAAKHNIVNPMPLTTGMQISAAVKCATYWENIAVGSEANIGQLKVTVQVDLAPKARGPKPKEINLNLPIEERCEVRIYWNANCIATPIVQPSEEHLKSLKHPFSLDGQTSSFLQIYAQHARLGGFYVPTRLLHDSNILRGDAQTTPKALRHFNNRMITATLNQPPAMNPMIGTSTLSNSGVFALFSMRNAATGTAFAPFGANAYVYGETDATATPDQQVQQGAAPQAKAKAPALRVCGSFECVVFDSEMWYKMESYSRLLMNVDVYDCAQAFNIKSPEDWRMLAPLFMKHVPWAYIGSVDFKQTRTDMLEHEYHKEANVLSMQRYTQQLVTNPAYAVALLGHRVKRETAFAMCRGVKKEVNNDGSNTVRYTRNTLRNANNVEVELSKHEHYSDVDAIIRNPNNKVALLSRGYGNFTNLAESDEWDYFVVRPALTSNVRFETTEEGEQIEIGTDVANPGDFMGPEYFFDRLYNPIMFGGSDEVKNKFIASNPISKSENPQCVFNNADRKHPINHYNMKWTSDDASKGHFAVFAVRKADVAFVHRFFENELKCIEANVAYVSELETKKTAAAVGVNKPVESALSFRDLLAASKSDTISGGIPSTFYKCALDLNPQMVAHEQELLKLSESIANGTAVDSDDGANDKKRKLTDSDSGGADSKKRKLNSPPNGAVDGEANYGTTAEFDAALANMDIPNGHGNNDTVKSIVPPNKVTAEQKRGFLANLMQHNGEVKNEPETEVANNEFDPTANNEFDPTN